MIVGIIKETAADETRVALVPAQVPSLTKAGLDVLVQSGAGERAGFVDSEYTDRGARLGDAAAVAAADIVLSVRALPPEGDPLDSDAVGYRAGQVRIGFCDPLNFPQIVASAAESGVSLFSMEMIPRITRAQSMDALSSMAMLAGYRAVLLAAETLPKIFPMMMTAAGTVSPAKVFVIGAGVAGLQAIATAKRLGAVVEAYDVRPAVKEQVESVGAKFLELQLETGDAQDKGGYAKELGEDFYRKRREMMAVAVAAADVVITAAAIPGREAPKLVTAEMVEGMSPGSVIVDLASERGGNCELTQAGQCVVAHGVTILGPLNVPAALAHHASQLYSKNITTFLLNMVKDGQLVLDQNDEIVTGTLLAQDGKIVHERLQQLLGIESEAATSQDG
ncbi:MAG: Re/Si-specific NAD(P)(+) transhydrogenase subunit alpha [Planctomycetales bacterium]|nr:Re/Si-specific NAD(P)(+) transhydrogenase subunit alpha [Planctomycetales bacterium]